MKIDSLDTFQKNVDELLARNRNILDILTKCQISSSKISRNTIKSATACGCIKIAGEKTDFTKKEISSCVNGVLCKECKSLIENEIGENLFYVASLCNALNLNLSEILSKEIKNLKTLGKYSLH